MNTDNINENPVSNNKFIINNTYGSNLTINGNLLVTSNLTVGGTSTILNTDVFTTEVLEITNEGGGDVAFKVTQKSAGIDIIRALNEGGEVFKLTSNGNIGIGTNPTEKLDVNGNMRLNGNILPLFNASSNIGSPSFGWSNIYFTGNLFKGGQLFIASNWDKVGNNINYPTYSVGIGSTTPTQKLDVAGNINIATGSTYKVGGTDISLVPEGSAGEYLIHNGTAWTPADILTLTNITGILPVESGGTGAVNRSAAAKNILPEETQSGKYLTYDGSDWVSSDNLTLTNIAAGTGNALSISKGGTNATSQSAAAINILPSATSNQYLTKGASAWGVANIPPVFWNSSSASTINYTGNVGIGSTAPEYSLDIVKAGTYIAGFRNADKTSGIGISSNSIIAIGSTTAQNITIGSKGTGNVVLQTNGASQVTVSGSGNVGIGTATISAKLHIAESTGTQRGANAGTIILDHDNVGGASSITFRSKTNRSSDYAYIQYQDDATIGGSGEGSRLIIGTENDAPGNNIADHILLMPSANIGVSNSNPAYKLDVLSDDTYIAGYRNTALSSGIGIGPANIVAIGSASTQDITIGSKSTGTVILQTNGTTRVTVSGNAGNVGIGSTVPVYSLDVLSDSVTIAGFRNTAKTSGIGIDSNSITAIGSATTQNIIIGSKGTGNLVLQTNATSRVTVLGSGFVGIGNAEPAAELHVTGDLVTTGEITAGFSDIRLKDEITLIENPLEMMSNINGFYYRHNELAKSLGFSDDKREVGLSAQEVQKVLPEIVRKAPFDIVRDNDNNIASKSGEDYLTICYERLIPVIVESIKELNNEISKLKKDNEELRRIISLSSINQTVADT